MTPVAPVPVEILVDKKKWRKKAGQLARFTANYRIRVHAIVEGVYVNNVDIPKGFVTDFASIPRWVPKWILSKWGAHMPAAAAHDRLYNTGELPRNVADGVFRVIMRRQHVAPWKIRVMYRAVRAAGWAAWRGHRKGLTPHGEGLL